MYLSEPYLAGGQPEDPRIIVRDQTVIAPGKVGTLEGKGSLKDPGCEDSSRYMERKQVVLEIKPCFSYSYSYISNCSVASSIARDLKLF